MRDPWPLQCCSRHSAAFLARHLPPAQRQLDIAPHRGAQQSGLLGRIGRRTSAPPRAVLTPSSVTMPDAGRSTPASRRSKVVLPAPLGAEHRHMLTVADVEVIDPKDLAAATDLSPLPQAQVRGNDGPDAAPRPAGPWSGCLGGIDGNCRFTIRVHAWLSATMVRTVTATTWQTRIPNYPSIRMRMRCGQDLCICGR